MDLQLALTLLLVLLAAAYVVFHFVRPRKRGVRGCDACLAADRRPDGPRPLSEIKRG
jgi:hypothetical protein